MSDDNDPFKYTQPREAAKGSEVTNRALGTFRDIQSEIVKKEQITSRESNREKQRNRLKEDYNKALKKAKEFAAQQFGQGSTMISGRPVEKRIKPKDIARSK